MNRIIIHKTADNINVLDPEMPSDDIRPHQKRDRDEFLKNKKKRFRK